MLRPEENISYKSQTAVKSPVSITNMVLNEDYKTAYESIRGNGWTMLNDDIDSLKGILKTQIIDAYNSVDSSVEGTEMTKRGILNALESYVHNYDSFFSQDKVTTIGEVYHKTKPVPVVVPEPKSSKGKVISFAAGADRIKRKKLENTVVDTQPEYHAPVVYQGNTNVVDAQDLSVYLGKMGPRSVPKAPLLLEDTAAQSYNPTPVYANTNEPETQPVAPGDDDVPPPITPLEGADPGTDTESADTTLEDRVESDTPDDDNLTGGGNGGGNGGGDGTDGPTDGNNGWRSRLAGRWPWIAGAVAGTLMLAYTGGVIGTYLANNNHTPKWTDKNAAWVDKTQKAYAAENDMCLDIEKVNAALAEKGYKGRISPWNFAETVMTEKAADNPNNTAHVLFGMQATDAEYDSGLYKDNSDRVRVVQEGPSFWQRLNPSNWCKIYSGEMGAKKLVKGQDGLLDDYQVNAKEIAGKAHIPESLAGYINPAFLTNCDRGNGLTGIVDQEAIGNMDGWQRTFRNFHRGISK